MNIVYFHSLLIYVSAYKINSPETNYRVNTGG
jgi:hypothetical protein